MTMPLDKTAPSEAWGRAPCAWTLGEDDVHVWRLYVGNDAADIGDLLESLTGDEWQRAGSYRRAEDRRRFAWTRAGTRRLLARYCGLTPRDVRFDQTPAGKPVLAGPAAASGLHFNVSHSGDFALMAFGRRRVGVDVECLRPDVACMPIARRYFSTREVADLDSLPSEQREAAFYRCWTRKEAYVKGTGMGISFGLASFSVSLLPQSHAALVQTPAADETPWRLFELPLAEGYAAALAVEGPADVSLALCDWSPNDP